jgi:hypothetical protein
MRRGSVKVYGISDLLTEGICNYCDSKIIKLEVVCKCFVNCELLLVTFKSYFYFVNVLFVLVFQFYACVSQLVCMSEVIP